jgi:AraC-like DNA-binding protein
MSGWVERARSLQPLLGSEPVLGDGSNPVGATISLAQFVSLTERIALAAQDAQLGWSIGVQYDLRRLGPIYDALLCARTLGAALRLLMDYFALIQDESELALTGEDGCFTVSYRILSPDIWPRHQDAIFTLGIIGQLIRLAAGDQWDKVQIGTECDDIDCVTRLAHRAGIPCTPGSDTNWLRIPAHFMSLAMPAPMTGTVTDLRLLNRLLVQKHRNLSVEMRVRSVIFRQLGELRISQESIARSLGMSGRTLRRHLATSATSFQALVDDCRLRQAAHEFRVRRNVSIAQTALRLGYSEHSTFTRAFSRWSGMPPQSFIRSCGPG